MRIFSLILTTLLGVIGTNAGCCLQPHEPGIITQSYQPQKVVLAPGILGCYFGVDRMASELQSETTADVQIWDWTALRPSTSPWFMHRVRDNLSNIDTNLYRAETLASELVDWRASNPKTPLYLVGISGGAGIVLWACERLPADFKVQKIILLSPAVSPGFDLRQASSRCVDGIYSFYSERDKMLHHDTVTEGTIDRQHVSAAGWSGFDCTQPPNRSVNLWELAWSNDMYSVGHFGNHFGCMKPAFVRQYVSPLMEAGHRFPGWERCSD